MMALILLSIFIIIIINTGAQSVLISQCGIPTEITDYEYGKCSNYERYESKGHWNYPVLHLFLDDGIGNLTAVLNDAKPLLSDRGTSCIHLTGNLNTSVDADDVIQATRNLKCVHLEGMIIRDAHKLVSKEKLILTKCIFDNKITFNLFQSNLSTLHITDSIVKGGFLAYLDGVADASRLDSVLLSSVDIRGSPSFNKMSEFIYDDCSFMPLQGRKVSRNFSTFSRWDRNSNEFKSMFTDSYGIFSRCRFRGLNHLNFHGSQLSFLGFDTCIFYKNSTLDISESKIITLNVSKAEYRSSGNLIVKGLNNAAELRKLELCSVEVDGMPNIGILQEFTIRNSLLTDFQERQSSITRSRERNLTDEVPATVGMSTVGNLTDEVLATVAMSTVWNLTDEVLATVGMSTVGKFESTHFADKIALNLRNSILTNLQFWNCLFYEDLDLDVSNSRISILIIKRSMFLNGSRLIVRGLQSLNNLTVLLLDSVTIVDKPALLNINDFACDHCSFASDLVLNFTKSQIRNITLTNPIVSGGSYVRLVGISECPLEQLTINGRVWVDDFSVDHRSVVMEHLRIIEIYNSIMGEIKIPTHGDYAIDLMDSNLSTLHVPSQEESKPIRLILGLSQNFTIKLSGPKLLLYMDLQSPYFRINVTMTETYCSEFGNNYYGKTIECSTELLDKNRAQFLESPTYTPNRIRHKEIPTEKVPYDCSVNHR